MLSFADRPLSARIFTAKRQLCFVCHLKLDFNWIEMNSLNF